MTPVAALVCALINRIWQWWLTMVVLDDSKNRQDRSAVSRCTTGQQQALSAYHGVHEPDGPSKKSASEEQDTFAIQTRLGQVFRETLRKRKLVALTQL